MDQLRIIYKVNNNTLTDHKIFFKRNTKTLIDLPHYNNDSNLYKLIEIDHIPYAPKHIIYLQHELFSWRFRANLEKENNYITLYMDDEKIVNIPYHMIENIVEDSYKTIHIFLNKQITIPGFQKLPRKGF